MPEPLDVDRAAAEALRPELAVLDPWQLAAVVEPASALVCAAVGSGKTRVLVEKLVWLHRVRGVPLERIAVVTFTRKAASEVAARLAAALQQALAPGQTWLMGTFHGVARSLLRSALPVDTLGFSPAFRVMDASERDAMLHGLIAEHDLDIKHRRRLEARFAALERGEVRIGAMKRDDDIVQLAELYEQRKRTADAMDFGDLIVGCGALLHDLPADQRPEWILVDELQDCDDDQLDLLCALAGETARVFAVGDPHQTIYGWRGSRRDTFERLAERTGAKTLRLPCNYRSTAAITQAAEALLVAGRATLDPLSARIVPQRTEGESVRIIRHHDASAEADWIARTIAGRIAAGAVPSRMAVLSRTRAPLDPVAGALQRVGIAIRRTITQSDEQATARWLHALLRAALDDSDLAALRIAFGDASRGLCRDVDLGAAKLADEGSARQRVADRLRAMARRRSRLDASLVERVIEGLQAANVSGETRLRPADALPIDELLRPTRAAYLRDRALCDRLLAAWEQDADARGGDLQAWHDTLAAALCDGNWLSDAAPPTPEEPEAVTLLTVHAAKGLEFDAVWLIGVNDGAFPIAGAMRTPDGLMEEVRLLFVAMTRARDELELSWHQAPTAPRAQPSPSPLLRLLPATTTCWFDHPPAPTPTPEAGSPDDDWPLGARVRHRKRGDGTVVGNEDNSVVVRFDRGGETRFAAAMMPCTRIDAEVGSP